MQNKNFGFFFTVLVVFLFVFALISFGGDFTGNAIKRSPAPKPQCNDKIDNDVDSTIDYGGFKTYPPDTDCSSAQDNTECRIACNTASNCGTNGFGASYCFNDDKYADYTTYNCNSPGTCGAYCTNNINPTLLEDCQATNPNGYCQGGQCVNPSNTTVPNSCTETDTGQDLGVQGTTTGYLSGFSYSKTDYCLTTSSVKEYWCVGDLSYEQNFNCPSGTTCISGACVSTQTNSCTDSDGGFNTIVKGTVSGQQNGAPYSFTDYCVGSTSIHEYYCVGGAPNGFDQVCQGNTTNICSNGACGS